MKEALRRATGLVSFVSVAGFFFTHRSNVKLQRSPLGLFMTLLYQLIQQDKALLLAFIAAYKRKAAETLGIPRAWRQEELQEFFKLAYLGRFPRIGNAMVFIDALDESGEDKNRTAYEVAHDLVHFFRDATGENKLKVCLSSRHYPNIKIPDCPQIATEKYNGDDIVHFITERLFGAKEDARAKKLAKNIAAKADGVFLWVILVVGNSNKSLGNFAITKDIEMILENIPGQLVELFKNLLREGSSETAPNVVLETTIKIFQWVLLAERPLEKDELRHALMINRQRIEAVNENEKWDSSHNCMPRDPEEFLIALRFYTRGLAEIILRWGTKRQRRIRHFPDHDDIEETEGLASLPKTTTLSRSVGEEQEKLRRVAKEAHWRVQYPSGEGEEGRAHLESVNNPYCPTIISDYLNDPDDSVPEDRSNLRLKRRRSKMQEESVAEELTRAIVSCSGVQLIHESVREFLKDKGFAILEGRDQPLSFGSRHEILAEYCMVCILNHGQMALEPQSSVDYKGYPFLKYAAKGLFYHVSQAELGDRVSKRVLQALVEDDQRLWKTWVNLSQHLLSKSSILSPDLAPLHYLCLKQMFLSTSYLLQLGVSVDTKDRAGCSALHYATEHAQVNAVHFLVKNGAGLRVRNQKGKTPLHLAAQCQTSEDILERLLNPFLAEKPCDALEDADLEGWRPLHDAVRAGNQAVVRILLSRGALVNSSTSNGLTSLHLAVESRSPKILDILLMRGADPNAFDKAGNGPIHLAAKHRNASFLQSLVGHRADVNIPNRAGEMPIHIRIRENLGVKFLIEAGAETNARTFLDRGTCLHLLVSTHPLPESMVAVIDAGVDVNAIDWREKTALHYAAEKGSYSIVELLLKKGGRDLALSLKDKYGRTPLHYAAQLTEMDVFRRLVDAGADPNVEDASCNTPVECAGDKVMKNSYLYGVFTLRGYRPTLRNIDGRKSKVLSLY